MICFGRFGPPIDIKEEKEMFLKYLIEIMYEIEGSKERKNYNEEEIIEPVKKLLKENINTSRCKVFLSFFLSLFGLSYYTLSEKEKEEILDFDYTYENWKIKSLELTKSFCERLKNVFPKMALFCVDDLFFIFYISMIYDKDFRYDNLLIYIRDYYILDSGEFSLRGYRDENQFKEVQKKVYVIYPIIKEKYGMNRTLEKICNFLGFDNDYSYKKSKKLLDDYYNKKQNDKIEDDEEKIKLKDKED